MNNDKRGIFFFFLPLPPFSSRAFLGCPIVSKSSEQSAKHRICKKKVSIKFYSIPEMGERVTDLQKVVELVKCMNLE